MLTIETRKLLFEMACTAVICDGHIDEREIKELHYIDTSTPYFNDLDLSTDIDDFINNYKKIGDDVTQISLQKLKNKALTPAQQLLALEIILRVIYSDEVIDKEEVTFIRNVRDALPISDEIIIQRFGEIDVLFKGDRSKIAFSNTGIDISSPQKVSPEIGNLYHGQDGKSK